MACRDVLVSSSTIPAPQLARDSDWPLKPHEKTAVSGRNGRGPNRPLTAMPRREAPPQEQQPPAEAPGEDSESAQRKVAAYQSLGVVSALLFGFSATVLYEITTTTTFDVHTVWAMNFAVFLTVVATVASMLSTFVYVYHSYHVESLLSTRVRRRGPPAAKRLYDLLGRKEKRRGSVGPASDASGSAGAADTATAPRLAAATLAFQWIDKTRGQRYVAQAGQVVSAAALLVALLLLLHLADSVVNSTTAWLCTVLIVAGFGVTGKFLVDAQRMRQRLRYGTAQADANGRPYDHAASGDRGKRELL